MIGFLRRGKCNLESIETILVVRCDNGADVSDWTQQVACWACTPWRPRQFPRS